MFVASESSPFKSRDRAPFGGFDEAAAARARAAIREPGNGSFGTSTTTATSTFGHGRPVAAPSAFGVPDTLIRTKPNPFGQPASAPSFGSPEPSRVGLFDSAASYNDASSVGTFGSISTCTIRGLFGNVPSATPFGNPVAVTPFAFRPPAPTAFGAPTSSSYFASATTFGVPTHGGFGQAQQIQVGSMVTPYETTTRQDGSTMIVFQAITGMPEYKEKSFEELRMEDYMAGNRGMKLKLEQRLKEQLEKEANEIKEMELGLQRRKESFQSALENMAPHIQSRFPLGDNHGSDDSKKNICIVCLDQPAVIAVVPCGHCCLCKLCDKSCRDCPLCRGDKESTLRIYMGR